MLVYRSVSLSHHLDKFRQLEAPWHRLTSGSSMAFDKLGASSRERRKFTNLDQNLSKKGKWVSLILKKSRWFPTKQSRCFWFSCAGNPLIFGYSNHIGLPRNIKSIPAALCGWYRKSWNLKKSQRPVFFRTPFPSRIIAGESNCVPSSVGFSFSDCQEKRRKQN